MVIRRRSGVCAGAAIQLWCNDHGSRPLGSGPRLSGHRPPVAPERCRLKRVDLQARALLMRLKEASVARLTFIPDQHDVSHLPTWVRAAKEITDGLRSARCYFEEVWQRTRKRVPGTFSTSFQNRSLKRSSSQTILLVA